MTDKRVEFFFDFGSPNAYLSHARLPALLERTGARLIPRPMLLGGVFEATDNTSPAATPCTAKRRHMRTDMQRFIDLHGIDFHFNDAFPINTIAVMRGAMAYLDTPAFPTYVEAVFRAFWADNRDMADPAVIADVLHTAGLDAEDFRARIESTETKQALREATDAAVARGVFGAPSFFVGEAMFFGQDRLDFVERALEAR